MDRSAAFPSAGKKKKKYSQRCRPGMKKKKKKLLLAEFWIIKANVQYKYIREL